MASSRSSTSSIDRAGVARIGSRSGTVVVIGEAPPAGVAGLYRPDSAPGEALSSPSSRPIPVRMRRRSARRLSRALAVLLVLGAVGSGVARADTQSDLDAAEVRAEQLTKAITEA